jgi:hypothetical protein
VTSATQPYDDSDSVLELSPSLSLEQYFAPSSWASDNQRDLDMSTAPALLADGQVVAAGKSRTIYLLHGSALGGIGGQEASVQACGDDIDGGVAVVGSTVFLPCLGGPVAVAVSSSPPGLRLLWSAHAGGGPPVVAAGLVWTIGQDGVLSGLSPSTGAVTERATVGAGANHFPTPSFGADLLVVAAADTVVAFAAPAAASSTTTTRTTPTSSPPSTIAATSRRSGPGQGPSPALVTGIVLGALVLLGAGVAWWRVRRNRSRGLGDPTQRPSAR